MDENGTYNFLYGLLFSGIALIAGILTLRSLPVGTLTNMGAGFFPLAISAVMFAIGAWLMGRSLVQERRRVLDAFRAVAGEFELLPLLAISVALVVFVLSIETLGILLSVFLTAVIATIKKDGISMRARLVLGISVATLCAAIFVGFIGMPLKLLPF